MATDWTGRVAGSTGGATGIGLALAKALAREGMDIVLASRSRTSLEAAAASMREIGRRVLTVVCDVSDRAQVYGLAGRANAEFGQVDMLCANAGATTAGRLVDHSDAEWDWAIGVNLRGVTHCLQAFYPAMVARGAGTILITGSQTALVPDWVSHHGPYIPAKGAILALATSLRAEAAEFGVAVSLLIPASTATVLSNIRRTVLADPDAKIAFRKGLPSPLPGFPMRLSPDQVAERAIAGLRANAEFIVTHAAIKPLVEDYFRRILAAYDEAARFESGLDAVIAEDRTRA